MAIVFSKEKRDNRLVIKKTAEKAIKDDCCPACGLHKYSWERRADWTCCSKKCTKFFYDYCVVATSWQDMRFQIYERDKHLCQGCGKLLAFGEFETDHIIPIAAGGNMWEKDNLRTLCHSCHVKKTRIDRIKIKQCINLQEAKKLLKELKEDGDA